MDEDQKYLIEDNNNSPITIIIEDENGDSENVYLSRNKKKSYGSLSSNVSISPKLTYTWNNLDVYGESAQQISGISLAFKKLKSLICKNQKIPVARKQLLKNIFGIAHSGELLAVLGSSGAGKSTLLNALAFRSPSGVQISTSAIRMLNGTIVDALQLRERCAYVQQEDLFIGTLTAKEHLIFQSMLRMDRRLSYKHKIKRVEEVIIELSLGKCQNTIIGQPGRIKGLSGGERKRLAFASEALTDPPILLCDEPTSGLDSFMAHNVLMVLKRMALKGKTIILTIHQPSSELYALFDKILLMAEGRVAFLGTPSEAVTFFNRVHAPCPLNYNPADYYVQILAIVPGKEPTSRETIRKICDTFYSSEISKNILDNKSYAATKKIEEFSSLEPIPQIISNYGYRATWWTQFSAILWRSWLTVLKEPLLVRVRIFQTVIVALLIGVIFYGQILNQDGVMNINGAIFLFLTNMTFQNVFAVINVFCAELPVFLRESRSRLYRTETYFLGKTLAELPLFLIVPFIFTSITYPLIGLQRSVNHYLITLGIVALVANVATSFGYLISCASSSVSMAISIGPPVIIPFLLFGGFFLNSGSVPYYFKWLSYLSWFRYGNEGLLINQWEDIVEGDIICTRSNATCARSGHIILETLNFKESNFQYDILGLCLLIIGFRFLAYLALLIRARSKE